MMHLRPTCDCFSNLAGGGQGGGVGASLVGGKTTFGAGSGGCEPELQPAGAGRGFAGLATSQTSIVAANTIVMARHE